MTIKLTTTTKEIVKCVKALVHGPAGIGKTMLAATAPKPIIISAEKGLMSLSEDNIKKVFGKDIKPEYKGFEIPVITIQNHIDLQEAYDFIMENKAAKDCQTVVLDSISDIGEVVLDYFKTNPENNNTNPQAAYGAMTDKLLPLIKKFRDIPNKNVYFIAKTKRVKDDHTGITKWEPAMPGQQLGPNLPYLFDLILAMRPGEDAKGVKYRYLQTDADIQWEAKDRSGKLNLKEEPHLGKIFNKILGK